MFSAELQDMESPSFKSLSRGLELEVMYVVKSFFKAKEMSDGVVKPKCRR